MNQSIYVPNSEKKEEYHKQWALYLISLYYSNRPDPFLKFTGININGYNGNFFGYGYADYYLGLYRYAMGMQNKNPYSFVTSDFDNNDVLGYAETGKQMKYIFDCIRGIFSDFVGKMEMNVISLSKDDTILKESIKNQLMLYVKNPELQQLFDEIGMMPSVLKNFNGKTEMDVAMFMKNFTLESETQILALAKNIIYINNYVLLFDKCLFDVLVTGRCSIKPELYGGTIRLSRKNPIFAGMDTSGEDPLMRNQNYAFEFKTMTAQEILTSYSLTETQKLRLIELDKAIGMPSNTNSEVFLGSPYWEIGGVRKFTVAETQWMDAIELTYIDSMVEQSNSREFKLKESFDGYSDSQKRKRTDKKTVSEYKKTARACVIIANEIVCNWGVKPNQVNVKSNSWETNIDYLNFIPDLTLGDSVSMAETLVPFQNKIDLYIKKIIDLVAKDKGFILRLESLGLPEGKTKFDVINDIIRHQMFETDVTRIERPELLNAYKDLVGILDLSLNYNSFREYTNAIEQETLNMMRAVNLYPPIVQSITSLNSQNKNQEPPSMATLGLKPLLTAFTQYLNRVIQYSCNLAKIGLTANGDYENILPLSSSDVMVLRLSKSMAFEDMQLYTRIDDGISKEKEKLLYDVVFNASQNGKIDVMDIFPILKNRSLAEMEEEFEQIQYKKEQSAILEQQAINKQELAMQQDKNQSAQQQTNAQMQMHNQNIASKQQQHEQNLAYDIESKKADIATKDAEIQLQYKKLENGKNEKQGTN